MKINAELINVSWGEMVCHQQKTLMSNSEEEEKSLKEYEDVKMVKTFDWDGLNKYS